MKTRSALTRRGFMTTAALGAASVGLSRPSALGVTARPREAAVAPTEHQPLRLNRNESPYGLAPAAAEALKSAVDARSYRYPIDEPKALEAAIAKRYGVEKENVILGYGSTEILKMATEAFCNSVRPAIVAEPTFEAVLGFCPFIHARAVKINLNAEHRHDLPRILRAHHAPPITFYS